MKIVEGTPWVKDISARTLESNIEILLKVADAVAFAHSRGVIHRDIKLENVTIGDFGVVMLGGPRARGPDGDLATGPDGPPDGEPRRLPRLHGPELRHRPDHPHRPRQRHLPPGALPSRSSPATCCTPATTRTECLRNAAAEHHPPGQQEARGTERIRDRPQGDGARNWSTGTRRSSTSRRRSAATSPTRRASSSSTRRESDLERHAARAGTTTKFNLLRS